MARVAVLSALVEQAKIDALMLSTESGTVSSALSSAEQEMAGIAMSSA